MDTINKKSPILVTGGSGYIASWIIKFLLEEGYTVHATVRNPDNKKKVAHLLDLENKSNGKLYLFRADLLDEGSFDEAIKNCELVMHTASPFVLDNKKNPFETLMQPAIGGTENVLNSALKTESVKRVILTSSVAAIMGDNRDLLRINASAFTEEHWNFSSSLKHQPYSYSKLMAEKKAWEICKNQKQWDMVVINPGAVWGPSLTNSSDSESIKILKQFGDGSFRSGVPDINFPVADVRDVAMAHINAGLTPQAQGRHIIKSEDVHFKKVADILGMRFGNIYPIPKKVVPKFLVWLLAPTAGFTRKFVANNIGYNVKFDNSKSINELDLRYRTIEETVYDHFQQMITDEVI